MKQSLQLKMGQHLTMTPQLQQAIRLLQLSTLDLQQEIQEIIDSNPMLEILDDTNYEEDKNTSTNKSDNNNESKSNDGDPAFSEPLNNFDETAKESDSNFDANDEAIDSNQDINQDSNWQENIPDELSIDTKWDDIYTHSSSPAQNNNYEFNEIPDIDHRNSTAETLSSHLAWQLNLTPMSEKDRCIAIAIIDALKPSGLLETTPEELLQTFDAQLEVEIDEIEAVRHRLQQFDPVGVASLDLTDCLMIQLSQLPSDTPWREKAAEVIDRHLNLLASRDYSQLIRRTKLKERELAAVIELIKSLNPSPGESFNNNTAEYVIPDVYVDKINNRWQVKLNPDIAPNLQINHQYASLIKRADTSTDNNFLKDNLQEAKWFLKSLHSRNETLLKVATKIVEHQNNFLELGEEAMKPLVLHDIATDVEMHESTISRVTTQKFMHTPRGIFELKYFFSSHVSTDSGGECSSTAIRAIIKKIIAHENTRKPLSDNKLAIMLAEQGITVARRTVAKYRESMMIPPSNERKIIG